MCLVDYDSSQVGTFSWMPGSRAPTCLSSSSPALHSLPQHPCHIDMTWVIAEATVSFTAILAFSGLIWAFLPTSRVTLPPQLVFLSMVFSTSLNKRDDDLSYMVDREVEIVQQWIEWDQGLVWQDLRVYLQPLDKIAADDSPRGRLLWGFPDRVYRFRLGSSVGSVRVCGLI